MKSIFVTASVMQELSLLIRSIGAVQAEPDIFPDIYRGRIGDKDITLAVTGIGKINAASATTVLLQGRTPDLLVNTGCAGAYQGSGLTVGGLAVATSEILADDGVLTPEGWQPLDLIGIPLVKRSGKAYFNEFPLSMQAAGKAASLAAALGLSTIRGKFLTVSTCSGTSARGDELFSRFGGICENMEGAAVAQVALRYGVDCLEIRGVSNMVENRDMSSWNIPGAVESVQRFLLKYIEEF
ncbi:futalosine hydrolase, putative [Geotalea daltonii FRC-32]|uniref:Futalosine hydrolase n=1 Tax=Geotalea daltonii (strain DSM 22248 / JCM 15807 / FRC-32) TaxID=316067 RepID=B9M1W4_GEODF|nr:futalosine hydrolase [Geotalea daltonii]ACM19260.1 futalosine hydrolase, putative [Geotalea daltonii FRC-32]